MPLVALWYRLFPPINFRILGECRSVRNVVTRWNLMPASAVHVAPRGLYFHFPRHAEDGLL